MNETEFVNKMRKMLEVQRKVRRQYGEGKFHGFALKVHGSLATLPDNHPMRRFYPGGEKKRKDGR